MLGANQRRRVRDIEANTLRLELSPGGLRFRDALFSQSDIAPAGEQIFFVPLALAVAHEHKKPVTHSLIPAAIA